MSNTMKINVNKVKAALELIRSFRNVPLDSIEWVDNAGKVYVHPTVEDAEKMTVAVDWVPIEDWKFTGLNNTSYFEYFIEPYIQNINPKPLFSPIEDFSTDKPSSIDLSEAGWVMHRASPEVLHDTSRVSLTEINGNNPTDITVSSSYTSPIEIAVHVVDYPTILNPKAEGAEDNIGEINFEEVVALSDIRECIGRQMIPCPDCGNVQVQLMDHLTNPLKPEFKCRSCKHRFHTTPIIPFYLLKRSQFGDMLKGQPVAAFMLPEDTTPVPVHLCKNLCCMNDGHNQLILPYSIRLLTEEERLTFSNAKSLNISEAELFDAMADEEPKYEQ